MANMIPCPNPVCTHQFSQAELQAAAQLACPKCGFRMQGRGPEQPKPAAPNPVASKSAAPAAQPVAAPKAVAVAQAKPVAAATAVVAQPAPAKVMQATASKPAPSPPLAAPIVAAPVSNGKTSPAPAAKADDDGGSAADGTFFNPADLQVDAGPLVHTARVKHPFNWPRFFITLFIVGFAVCVVVAAFGGLIVAIGLDRLRDLASGRPDGDTHIGKLRAGKGESEAIYKLVLPRREWAPDNEIRHRFDAHAAFKSIDYEGCWFALVVKDYGMHKPRDPEMLRFAVAKLDHHFADGLELGAKTEPGKFGELPSLRLQFRGDLKSARWNGECHMFFNNGIAYWLFLASPEKSVVEFFADELPAKHVFVVSDRRGWREQPAPTETFISAGGKFDVTALKGAWSAGDPKLVDEKYEMLLSGRYLIEKNNSKNAIITVFTVEKQADLAAAMKAARAYIEKKAEEDNALAKVNHAAEVTPGQSSDLGEQKEIGNRFGRIIDLKEQLKDEDKARRYYLLAVVNEPDATYAFKCECAWEARAIWRQEFFDVLKTFRVRKAE
jgi:hypothetical protein